MVVGDLPDYACTIVLYKREGFPNVENIWRNTYPQMDVQVQHMYNYIFTCMITCPNA